MTYKWRETDEDMKTRENMQKENIAKLFECFLKDLESFGKIEAIKFRNKHVDFLVLIDDAISKNLLTDKEKFKEINTNQCPFKQFLRIDLNLSDRPIEKESAPSLHLEFELEKIDEDDRDIYIKIITHIKDKLFYILHSSVFRTPTFNDPDSKEYKLYEKLLFSYRLCEDFLENNDFYSTLIILNKIFESLNSIELEGNILKEINLLKIRIEGYLEFLSHY